MFEGNKILSISNKQIKDLTGQKFGEWTVLGYSGSKDRKSYWLCECSCGNKKSVCGSNLTTGKSTNCGCLKYKKLSKQLRTDLTNKRFGKLVVLEYAYSKNEQPYWKCKCDCGAITFVRASDLRMGKTKSCGCLKSIGEEKISNLLTTLNIKYEREKTFKTCKFPDTNALARFDFYLPDYNLIIEYDGIQHFKTGYGWNDKEKFKKTQQRDEFKNQWCKENNIPLIRIPYSKLDKINEDYLKSYINS